MEINVTSIKSGLPGITPIAASQLYEAFEVCMHTFRHSEKTRLTMAGMTNESIYLLWTDNCNSSFGSTLRSPRPKACQITGRGETPANQEDNASPEGATGLSALCSAAPSGLRLPPLLCRGFTPACVLNAPSGLCGMAFPTSET